jgi:Amt family ammonium transporter
VATQAYGIIVTIVYCAIVTFVILKVIHVTLGLRVDEATETVGLDIKLHGERAYD